MLFTKVLLGHIDANVTGGKPALVTELSGGAFAEPPVRRLYGAASGAKAGIKKPASEDAGLSFCLSLFYWFSLPAF
ncbi:hypothetical protein D0Y96_016290 [Acidipila sp. 4G-K13]|nr:hypothetical protein [Paracidobacterium acidisoli]